MVALQSSLWFMSIMGLAPHQNKVIKWFYLSVVVYNMVPQFMYLITYHSDVIKVTGCLPTLFENCSLGLKLFSLIYNHQEINHLFKGITDFFKPAIRNPEEIYAESRSRKVFKNFGIIIFSTWLLFAVVPMCIQFFEFLFGTAEMKTYEEPFNNMYFYDNSASGVYQISYFISSLTLLSVSVGIIVIDGLFCALCIHLIGILKAVQKDIAKYRSNEIILYSTKIARKITLEHNAALRLHTLLEKSFSPIIFLQYMSSIFIICTCLFQSVSVEHTFTAFVTMISLSVAAVAQLLIYCWFGASLTEEHYKIGELIYELPWYNYSPKVAKELQMIIRKSQKHLILTGLGFCNCNLVGFMSVINTSMSAVAVLQSQYLKM